MRILLLSCYELGHPALTELALDLVAAFEGRVQAGDGVRLAHLPKMPVGAVNREKVPIQNDRPPKERPVASVSLSGRASGHRVRSLSSASIASSRSRGPST